MNYTMIEIKKTLFILFVLMVVTKVVDSTAIVIYLSPVDVLTNISFPITSSNTGVRNLRDIMYSLG